MTLNLTPLEAVTVGAFLTALHQLDSPLPADLQQEVNKVGETFENNPTVAVNRLLDLGEQDCIKKLYQQARIDIQNQYEVREQNRYDLPNQQKQPDPTPSDRLANIAVPILKDPNPVAKAKEHKTEIIQHLLPHPI